MIYNAHDALRARRATGSTASARFGSGPRPRGASSCRRREAPSRRPSAPASRPHRAAAPTTPWGPTIGPRTPPSTLYATYIPPIYHLYNPIYSTYIAYLGAIYEPKEVLEITARNRQRSRCHRRAAPRRSLGLCPPGSGRVPLLILLLVLHNSYAALLLRLHSLTFP